jgi:hypothetical protein
MSEYRCFKCNKIEHCSDLIETEWRGEESLLCVKCFMEIKDLEEKE